MTTLDIESPVDNVVRALDAAERATGDYGAFVTLFRERALAEAASLDGEPRRGPLHGVPVAVKDNMDVAGAWTRCGTPGFGHHRAEHDADVVARLRAAGAVVIGKTRMHELAWGMITPGCRNPHDPARITGGSSGGSAAAVASGAVPVALGTDTGGSVRNPAALCGVVGMKTAAGSLPMGGVTPLAPTQDTVGVLAASVEWCRRTLDALGIPTTAAAPRRVGLLTERWARRVEPEVEAAVSNATRRLREAGIEVVEPELPRSGLAAAASYVTMLAEAAREWWPGPGPPPPGSLGKDIRGLLMTGARVGDADYARALAARAEVRAELAGAFEDIDALLLATCPVVAAPAGSGTVRCAGREIPVETAHSALTAPASVSGMPAVSVPAADPSGLPVGLQFVAPGCGALCSVSTTLQVQQAREQDG